jgi:hypothetical protein
MAPATSATKRTRGPNQNPTKSKPNARGAYLLVDPKAKQAKAETEKKRRENAKRFKTLQSELAASQQMVMSLQAVQPQSMVTNISNHSTVMPSPSMLAAACTLVRTHILTPLNIMVAQLTRAKPGNLNFSCLDDLRAVQPDIQPYERTFIPARSTVQKVHKQLTLAGEKSTLPTFAEEGDLVLFNTRRVIEEILEVSGWPGCTPAEDGSYSQEEINNLKPLQLDATADGARLTATQGIIVQGLKVVSPEIVVKLAGHAKSSGRTARVADAKSLFAAVADVPSSESASTQTSSAPQAGYSVTGHSPAPLDAVQSANCVLLTGFLSGSEDEKVNGLDNAHRYVASL